MPDFGDAITRDTDLDPLVPTPVAAEVIQELPQSSAVLRLARRVPMSTKTTRQPVLSVLPQAYFVNGDTGLKQTSKQDWENLTLVAEELAVIVPIPEAYLSDAQVPIWDEVRPRIAEAIGKKIDLACLFDVDKPTTWGAAVVPHAVDAGNFVHEGDGEDLAVDVANMARKVAEDGFSVQGFASGPGLRWRLVGLRSSQGIPIYAPPAGDQPGTLFGFGLGESLNGGWITGQATLVGGDWSEAIVGVRQDISWKVFTEGVITDDAGNVVINLMQQDTVALRAVMRVAWQISNPVTQVNTDKASRSAFGVVNPLHS